MQDLLGPRFPGKARAPGSARAAGNTAEARWGV